ncbi:MAG: hypothetical protein ACRDO0_16130 [Nocardioidaceae bacterium]
MTVIGAILLLISVLLLLGAIFGGSEGEVQLDLGVVDISMSVLSVFLVGAASVLLFVCGLELLRSGTRRSLRRRRELKHARAVVAQHEQRQPSETQPSETQPSETQPSEGPADDTTAGETRRDEVGTADEGTTTTADTATDSVAPDDSTRRTESGPPTEPGPTQGSDPGTGPDTGAGPDTRDPGRQ